MNPTYVLPSGARNVTLYIRCTANSEVGPSSYVQGFVAGGWVNVALIPQGNEVLLDLSGRALPSQLRLSIFNPGIAGTFSASLRYDL